MQAETNFLYVVPQAKRIRLSLKKRLFELHDPQKRCKEVSEVGRRGNGDVEVGLPSLDELPYVMVLVPQSLNRHMSTGSEGA